MQNQENARPVIFHPQEIKTLVDALDLLEEQIKESGYPLPNLAFARQVSLLLRRKLRDLLESEEWEKEISLDFNEICILHAAINMLFIQIMTEKDQKKQRILPVCSVLCRRFDILFKEARKPG